MGKVEVTRADREAAAMSLNEGGYAIYSPTGKWVNDGSCNDRDEDGELFAFDAEERIAVAIATARAEGRADERRDVVAFLRRCEGWRAPKLAESIDDECHVGDHELYSAAKDSP